MAYPIRCRSLRLRLSVLLLALWVPLPALARDTATVVRVVDGDTLETTLNGRPEKVRLIGVDTPEKFESDKLRRDVVRTGQDEQTLKALGQQASRFTERLVRPGDQVQLEYDQQPRDRDKRLLAFVWLADGRLLNEVLICEGYANVLTRYPFRTDYMERFRTCERQAREQGRGLWGEGLTPQDTALASAPRTASAQAGEVRGNRQSQIYHLPGCPDYRRLKPENMVLFSTEEEAHQAGYRKARNCP